jgi:MATE family multidrug resistance protein
MLAVSLLRLALPVTLSRLGFMGMMVADTIVVGQIAPAQLPFYALGAATHAVFLVGGIGLLMGVQVLAARVIGEGRPETAGTVWRRGMALGAIAGVLSGVILAVTAAPLLKAFGVEADLIDGASRVAQVLAIGMPLHFMFQASAYFVEAVQKPRVAATTIWIANAINIAMAVALTPTLGAVGCAWATLASRVFMVAGVGAWIWFAPSAQRYGVRAAAKGAPDMAALLGVGVAAAVSQVAEAGAFSGLTVIAGRLSADAVSAYQILLNVLAIVFMVALGMSAATSVLVSDAYGRGDPKGVVRAGWTGIAINCVLMTIAAVCMVIFATPIAEGFTADRALAAVVAGLMPLAALAPVPDGAQALGSAALRARADNWFPTASHVFAYVFVMPPLAFYFAEMQGMGVRGLITAILCASAISGGVLVLRFAALRLHIGERAAQPDSQSASLGA